MVEETIKQLLSKLIATQKQVITLLESVCGDQDWQPDAEQWSFRYIAAHMAIVEKDCYRDRVRRIAANESPHFESYFNTGWDLSQFDLQESLNEWTITRREIIDFVRTLPKEKWSLTGTHATFGTIKLHNVLQMMLDHDREHLSELEQAIDEYRTRTQSI